jgi:hypothetical protein
MKPILCREQPATQSLRSAVETVAHHRLRDLSLHVVAISQQRLLENPMAVQLCTQRGRADSPRRAFDLDRDLIRRRDAMQHDRQANESVTPDHRKFQRLVLLGDGHERDQTAKWKVTVVDGLAYVDQDSTLR